MENKKNYEENRFHLGRHEIAQIGDELNMDVNDASYEYAHRKGWDVGEGGAELEEYQEFLDHVLELQRTVKVGEADNAVRRYFYEG